MTRLRLLGVTVIPSFVMDDGDNLIPLKVEPLTFTATQWPDVIELFQSAVADLRTQVENP